MRSAFIGLCFWVFVIHDLLADVELSERSARGIMIDAHGTPDTQGICKEAGFRRNATDPSCAQFYRCVDFFGNGKRYVIFQFVCGPMTVFDEKLSICTDPARAYPRCGTEPVPTLLPITPPPSTTPPPITTPAKTSTYISYGTEYFETFPAITEPVPTLLPITLPPSTPPYYIGDCVFSKCTHPPITTSADTSTNISYGTEYLETFLTEQPTFITTEIPPIKPDIGINLPSTSATSGSVDVEPLTTDVPTETSYGIISSFTTTFTTSLFTSSTTSTVLSTVSLSTTVAVTMASTAEIPATFFAPVSANIAIDATPVLSPKPSLPALSIDCSNDSPRSYPYDCSRFYQCFVDGIQQSIFVYSCASGLIFNESLSQCVTPSESTCQTVATVPNGFGGTFQLKCGTQDLYRYPLTCNTFYQCFREGLQETIYVYSCADDLVFDEPSASCKPQSETAPCDNSSAKKGSPLFRSSQQIDVEQIIKSPDPNATRIQFEEIPKPIVRPVHPNGTKIYLQEIPKPIILKMERN